jgi:Domain of unknown function (DUF397)
MTVGTRRVPDRQPPVRQFLGGVVVDLSAAVWVKSTHSVSNGCVEVAFVDGQIAVRDSKNKDGAILVFTSREWDAFIGGVADGQFRQPEQHTLG